MLRQRFAVLIAIACAFACASSAHAQSFTATTIGSDASVIFRDYNTTGVPSSGVYNPKKSDMRSWGGAIGGAITELLGGAGSAGLGYATLSDLNADLAHPANTLATVFSDGTSANDGIYIKSGASGSGSWTQVATGVFGVLANWQPGTATALVGATAPTVSVGGTPAAPTLSIGVPVPEFSVGTVTTVSPTTPAAVSQAGTAFAPVLNFSIPIGVTPTFSVGTVSTVPYGSSPTASITGTAVNPVLNLGVPSGPQGNFNWRGAWSSATAYVLNDVVGYGGSTYIANAPSTNATPGSASQWDVFVAPSGANMTLSGTTSITGSLNQTGTTLSLLGGVITDPSQVANSVVDIKAKGLDGVYHDNVASIQNKTVGTGSNGGPSGQCGSTAFRMLDYTGIEHAAFGYASTTTAQVAGSACTSAFDGGNAAFIEISNLAAAGNPDNGKFSINVTNGAGAPQFPNSAFQILTVDAKTDHIYTSDHNSLGFLDIDNENKYVTMNGSDGIAGLQFHVQTQYQPAEIYCTNGSGAPCAVTLEDKVGAGVFLKSYNNNAFQAANPAGAVNWIEASGSTAGNGVELQFAGSDTNGNLLLSGKGTGNVQALGDLVANTFLKIGITDKHQIYSGGASVLNFALANAGTVTGYLDMQMDGAGNPMLDTVMGELDLGVGGTAEMKLTSSGVGFGTYTGTTCTNAGYITINDLGGTSRKVMVCA